MSSREGFIDRLNKLGASKASAQLKILLSLAVFGIAIALLISGIHAESPVEKERIGDDKAVAPDKGVIEVPAEKVMADVSDTNEPAQQILNSKERHESSPSSIGTPDEFFKNLYILFLESPVKVKGASIASIENFGELESAMAEKGIAASETLPELNAIVAYVPDSQISSLDSLPNVVIAEKMEIFHALLDVSVPQINADIVQDMGYNGSGTKVCIVDTGMDKWHSALKQPTASADFTTHDWCLDLGFQYLFWNQTYNEPLYSVGEFASVSGGHQKYNMSLNVTNNSLNWLEMGVTSYDNGYGGQRYDITVYWPNGTKINDTSGLANTSYRTDADANRWYIINVSIGSTTGLYTIEINETNIVYNDESPLVIWGSNVTSLYNKFYAPWNYATYYYGYFYGGCDTIEPSFNSSNPSENTTDRDSRAFNNIVANDDAGHGTHVAGTIVSNNTTYKGVAPGANLYIAKALDSYGSGNQMTIEPAINWCKSQNVSVISMSLGGPAGLGCNDSTAVLVDNMTNYNIISVIAAGNEGPGSTTIGSPGCARDVLTVGAVDSSDDIAFFSSRGPTNDTQPRTKPEILAPGYYVHSTIPGNRWVDMPGTSMATPHVAGVAALLLEKNPSWIPQDVKAALINAADQTKVGFGAHNNSYGYGRVDALEAVNNTWVAHINITNNTIDSSLTLMPTSTKNLKVTMYWEDKPGFPLTHNKIYLNITNSSGNVLDYSDERNDTVQQVTVSSATAGTYTIKIIGANTRNKTVWIAANEFIYGSGPVNCDNCSNCDNALAVDGAYVRLNANITTADPGTCLYSFSNNTIFDCAGHSIKSTNGTDFIADVADVNNVTIKNCITSNFSHGISFENSDGSKLINNTIYNIDSDGVTIDGSHDNLVTNNTIFNTTSGGTGLRMSNTQNGQVINNTIKNVGYSMGIYLGDSNNTLILNNKLNRSLYISYTNYTNVTSNKITDDELRAEASPFTTIKNNTLYLVNVQDAMINDIDYDSYNVTIVSNTMHTDAWGIHIIKAFNSTRNWSEYSFTIANNTINNTSPWPIDGISIVNIGVTNSTLTSLYSANTFHAIAFPVIQVWFVGIKTTDPMNNTIGNVNIGVTDLHGETNFDTTDFGGNSPPMGGGLHDVPERFANGSGIYYFSPYTVTASIGSCGNMTLMNVDRSLTPFQMVLPCSNWQTFHHDNDHQGYIPDNWTNLNHTIWTYTTGDYVVSAPTVADRTVFVGSEDDNVYAIDAIDGTQLWNFTTGSYVTSAPAVAHGIVYVSSWDNKLYALDERNGEHIWNYTTGGWLFSSPAVADGIVYVGSKDKIVYAVNATAEGDGTQIWNYTTGGSVYSSPAVANGVVYVGSQDNNVYALNATTGTKIWNYTTGSWIYSSPAVANGVVYVGSENGNLYALNATTGSKIWNYTTIYYVDSSPAVHNGVVYFGSDDFNVYALNATTGAQLWNYTTGNYVKSSPAVADGIVYVGSDDGNTYALNATTGSKIWNITIDAGNSYSMGSSPAVAYGYVYIGSWDNKVYAFGPSVVTVGITSPGAGSTTGKTAWLNATTNINTTCKYGTSSNPSTNFANGQNTQTHSQQLTSLPDGSNTYYVNCTDGHSNYSESSVTWTVDAVGPTITVITPQNITYGSTVVFNITTSEPSLACNFSLSSAANVSMTNTTITAWNYTKTNITDGAKNIKFYCTDMYNNKNVSQTAYFTVNTNFTASITSPINKTYNATDVDVNVTTNMAADTCIVSLDGKANGTLSNSTATNWYSSETGLSEGPHNVTVWCNNTYGLSDLKIRYFSVDTIPPTITIVTPQDITYGKTVVFNVSTSESAAFCRYSLDGNANVTMTNSSLTRWTTTNSSMANGGHQVVFYCNDLYNNTGTNMTDLTVDALGPTITIVVPQNSTYGKNVTFSITSSEPASTCKFSFDGAANVTMTNSSTTAWSYAKTGMTEAAHNIKFWCTDVYNNTNVSITRYFSVNESFLATITYPVNQHYNRENITANVSTSAGADTCLISVDGKANDSMSNTSATAWYYDMTSLSETAHNLSVWCNSSAGTLSSTATGLFTVDLTKPTITTVTPANTTYSKTVIFNVTTNEPAAWCKYSLDGTANVSMNGSSTSWYYTNSSMANGAHSVLFYCSDLAGNENYSATRYFTVDIIAPTIGNWDTLTAYKNNAAIDVTVHGVSDTGIGISNGANCNFKINGSTSGFTGTVTYVAAQSLCDGTITLSGTLADGTYLASINVSDNVGNYNTSSQQFKIDTTNPSITVVSPSNTTYGNTNIWFNITATDANLSDCGFSLDGNPNAPMAGTGSSRYANNSNWSGSTAHTIVYFCNDTAGNIGNATRVFTVDTVAPTITVNGPLDGPTYPKSVLFNVTTNEPAAWCNYSLDGAANVSMTNSSTTAWTKTNSSMTNGGHQAVFYCADRYGNVGSADRNVLVDAFGPTITIVVPQNMTYGKNVTFSITSSEPASICKFSFDGAANVNMTNSSTTAWTYLKTNMAETAHNIKFNCTDVYSNTNVSSTMYFSVNTSFMVTITSPQYAYYNGSPMDVTATTNSAANACKYSLDSAANVSMGNSSATSWNNVTGSLGEGDHDITVWCNSSAGALSSTAYVAFTVYNTTPTIDIISPENTTYGTDVYFAVDLNHVGMQCNFSLDSGTNTSMQRNSSDQSVFEYTNSNTADGSHNIVFYCKDGAQNFNWTGPVYFTVDAVAPILTINAPQNMSYASTTVLLNVTTDEPSSCGVCIDNGCGSALTNTTPTEWSGSWPNVSQGTHIASFTCVDMYQNINDDSVYFTIDTTAPTITLTTPANNTWRNDTIVDFKFYVNDSGAIANCTAHSDFVDITNTTAMSKTAENSITQSIPGPIEDNNFHWYVNCTDIAGNVGKSVTRVLKLDDTRPGASLDYPPDGSNFTTSTVHVNVSVTEKFPNRLLIYKDGVLTSNTTAINGTNSVNLNFADGTYKLYALATDMVNHLSDKTPNATITVDTRAPVFTNVTAVDITNESAVVVAVTDENSSCNAYKSTDGSTFSIEGGMQIFAGPPPYGFNHNRTFWSLQPGTLYYYKINCHDSFGNTANSSIYDFTTASYQSGTVDNSTITNMTFNFTENGTETKGAELELLLNSSTNATVELLRGIIPTTNFSVSGYTGAGTYYTIESDQINASNIEWVLIKLYYNKSNLPSGVLESTLRLYWYNNASAKWEQITPGGVDTVNSYVWGNATHFSEYTFGGQKETGGTTGGSSGGTGGGMPSTGMAYAVNLDINTTSTKGMSVNDIVNLTVGGEKHTVKLLSLTSISAVVEISSTPQNVTLNIGILKAIDLNGDGTNDIELKLESVTSGIAKVVFTKLAAVEKISGPTTPSAAPTGGVPVAPGAGVEQPSIAGAPAAKVDYRVYIAIVVLLAIAVIAYVWLAKKAKE